MGMPRRMEQYNDPAWQPYLMVAALGAFVVLRGIACHGDAARRQHPRPQARRRDVTGDPWDGRTLEWATSSPPPPYNFAVLPEVRDREALLDMKERGVAYQRPAAYEDIHMPKNTLVGVVIGAFAFVAGLRHGLAHLVAGGGLRARHVGRHDRALLR